MTDFLRSLRITELKNRASYWTDAKFKEYYGPVQVLKDPVFLEPWENGYVSVTTSSAEYTDVTTGASYKLKKAINEKDWECYNSLYTKLSGTLRLEAPSYRAITGSMEYIEFGSPSAEFGETLQAIMSNFDSPEDHRAFLTLMIDTMATVFSAAKEVAAEKKSGVTLAIFDPMNYWRDSSGMFVTGLDSNWNVPVSTAITTALHWFELSSSFAKSAYVAPLNLEMIEYAREKWI